MLQHKYKKTGKGLLGVIDKHIHATVAVIISTVVIVASCYIGNSIEQDNICFADTNIDFKNLQDNEIKMYITNEDIMNNIKTATKETTTEKVIYYDIPLSKEEKEKGLVSEIKEGVKLEGATIRDNIAFVSLSSDFLLSDDLEMASEEIYKTLYNNLGIDGLVILVDENIVIRK